MISHFINNTIVVTKQITTQILGEPLQSKDIEFMLHYMITKHPFASALYCITVILILFFIIAGIVLLIIQLTKNRHKLHINKGKFEIGTIRKTVVYFTAPVTLVTFAGMSVLTVISIF